MVADNLTVLRQPHIQQFIRKHESSDSYQLSLQAKQYPNIPIQLVAEQIKARQKAKKKLPEWYQTEGIIFPPLLSMEQCSSEATAKFKSSLVSGLTAVDLTGGTGVDTYYLSRRFDQVDYVEQNPSLAAIAKYNFKQLGASTIKTHASDAESFLSSIDSVDLIYLDPSRRDDTNRKVFRLSDCSPDVTQLLSELLAKAQQVMIKASPMLDIDAALQDLKWVSQVYVVAVGNECREVLYLLSPQATASPLIKAIDIASEKDAFIFTREEETQSLVSFSEPLQYLYEPNAAILKAGAFRSVAHQLKLAKLHPHTHLYTSDQPVKNFPGRIFRIEAVVPYQKKKVKEHIPDDKVNITTRNFSDSVATIRKKLGMKEGGDTYLFATQTQEQKRMIIITRKLRVNK